jgi:CarD family transcriptional regulator
MTFRIGDKVVYPNQGIGTVDSISVRSQGATATQFYLLRFGSDTTTVLVPLEGATGIGLRPVRRGREIERVLNFLANGECPAPADWKVRYRENSEKMSGGDLLKTAEVCKSLLRLKAAKALSFREHRMLDRARYMLVAEIAIGRGIPESQALAVLQNHLEAAGLTLRAEVETGTAWGMAGVARA